MKRLTNVLVILLCVFAGILLSRCSVEEIAPQPLNSAAPAPYLPVSSYVPCGDPLEMTFYAGQHIDVGTITVSNDASDLYVSFHTTGDWVLNLTHLFVGDCDSIPTNRSGNPRIGHFPYQTPHAPPVTDYSYVISLADLQDSCFCVAAHAEVFNTVTGQGETAWGSGDGFSGNSWATFFSYCKQVCDTDVDDCLILPGDYRTQTQGGWGSRPRGNNPGVYNQSNFAGTFPNGLVVGCPGQGGYSLTLNSDFTVRLLLPEGGTPAALTQDYVDPMRIGNVFVGQVVALTLSVNYDRQDPNFGASNSNLGELVLAGGPLAGLTVDELLAEANLALGGCYSRYAISDLNEAVSKVNENFVDGTTVGSTLICL